MPDEDRKTRYGQNAGTGANETKQHERKEQRLDWKPRQVATRRAIRRPERMNTSNRRSTPRNARRSGRSDLTS